MVASIDDEGRRSRITAFARGLKEIHPEYTYFAATLLGSDTGWNLIFDTRFAGFPDGKGPDGEVELREPEPVDPDRMTRRWQDVGQGWVVVNKRAQLIWLFRFGGNALIAEEVAREYLAEFVEPIAMVRNGAVGFRRFDSDAREVIRRRPRPWQKKRILHRDGPSLQGLPEAAFGRRGYPARTSPHQAVQHGWTHHR